MGSIPQLTDISQHAVRLKPHRLHEVELNTQLERDKLHCHVDGGVRVPILIMVAQAVMAGACLSDRTSCNARPVCRERESVLVREFLF